MLKQLLTIVASSLSFANHPSSAVDVEFIDCGTDIIYVEPSPISTMSVGSHPVIDGFDWIYSYNSPKFVDDEEHTTDKIGYMYMDIDLYTTRFTSQSVLLLMHTTTSCTSGNTASIFSDDYNERLDLDSIKVLNEVPQMRDNSNGYTTGSVNLIEYWPKSTQQSEAVINSETGFDLDLDLAFEAGVDAGGATLKFSPGVGLTISFGNQAVVTQDEPSFSSERSPISDDWPYNSYEYSIQYSGLGKVTYTLETYSLFEIVDDGIGFNDFSFVVVYDATMDVVENKDLPLPNWPFAEKHHQLYKGTQLRYNLGYNPSDVTFFGTPHND